MVRESGEAEKDLKLTNMREIIWMIRSTGTVFFNGKVETSIKENIKMMKGMDMEKWDGLMEVHIKENGSEEYSMVMEKWFFLMDKLRKDFLSTMSLKEIKKTFPLKIWCDLQELVLIFMQLQTQFRVFLKLKI